MSGLTTTGATVSGVTGSTLNLGAIGATGAGTLTLTGTTVPTITTAPAATPGSAGQIVYVDSGNLVTWATATTTITNGSNGQ